MFQFLKSYKLVVLLLSYLVGTFQLQAADTIRLKGDEEIYVVGSYLDILEDPAGKLTFEQVSSTPYNKRFKLNTKIYPYSINENTTSTYWIRLKIDGKNSSHATYIAQFYNPTISSIEIFRKNRLGKIVHFKAGDQVSFENRDIQHNDISFEVPVTDTAQTIYFKVRSNTYSGFTMSLIPVHDFISLSLKEYYLEGIYLGLILVMVIYNLMIFISVRGRIYIYYCCYALSCAFYSLNYSRIGFHFLWPGFPQFNLYAPAVISTCMLLTFTLYSTALLKLKIFLPRIIKLFNVGILVVIIFNAAHELFSPQTWLADFFFYSSFLFIYILSFMIMRKGYKPAKYFFIGFSFIALSFIVTFLESINVIRPVFLSIYSFQLSFIIEIMVFSFALASRLRIIKKEKQVALKEKNEAQKNLIKQYKENDLLKDKVNKELEDKVQVRTMELNSKNEELRNLYKTIKEQSEELSKWNVKLDLDNRKLSSEIKDVIASKVLVKNVEFEDFNKIFPDDFSCYRFLEELKWSQGYKCLNCGNEKYFETKNTFSRKCTKCRFEESIIYNTIFQGSKIPIAKQFYMLFLIYSHKGEITSTELAETLSMRLKTCWTFHKKVKERMKGYSWDEMDGWDSLILMKEEK